MPEHDHPVILRRKDVERRTGLKRSTLYQKISIGAFPRPIQIGPRCVGWLIDEVDSWIRKCVETSRNSNKQQGGN
ncbi:MAG: AlpA family phage regulatory protein [Deltaproteobacteria bacterium]|nr:AlpA family phage regulatory protein [Deltaproteobacteria bacterium]